MTTRYVQPGKVLDYANGSTARASGDVVVVGTMVGVCLAAIAANAVGSVMIAGVFDVPKLGTDTPAQGALVYWDATNSRMTTTASGNTLAGKAFEAAGSGTTTMKVLLNGLPA
jgi:predicted RecA/RadA family phage recombinase